MVKQVNLDWSQGIKIGNEFFPEDKLGRAKYATFLTKLLASQGFDKTRNPDEQKRNYVLNLNAEWGSGKTYFLKRWSEDLKEHYPVVYIDAWKKDYSDDPLMTVVSSIIEQLRKQAGKDKDAKEFRVPRKLIGLLKAAAPGIGRGLFKRYVGIDPVEIMNADDDNENLGSIKGENGKDLVDENGKPIDMSFAASEAVKYLIDEHDAKSAAIESLKTSVFEWVTAVTGIKKKELPAFIFIDELDRCRPSYAVEMLETIKHIFDISGVVFVVATDTEQLQHAVKVVYGDGFDANIYLGRFFNSRYSLKAPNLENFLDVHSDVSRLSGDYFRELQIEVLPFNEDANVTLRNISIVLDAFKVSARTAIQIADRVVATLSNMPRGSKIDILMLTALLCIKEKDHNLFDEIVCGKFERVVQNGDSKKTIYLNDFLETYIPESSHMRHLEMHFDPKEYAPNLNIYSYQSPITNPYKSGVYRFYLLEYLKEVFSSHFDSNGKYHPAMFLMGESRRGPTQEQTPLEKICKTLYEEYRKYQYNADEQTSGVPALLWVKFFYIRNKFESIDMDEYKDFVELASPLDWMGKDELPNID
ncbi:KAP family P-loop NTPase fold protein [Vibrio cholerae]|uniref:KAP family P-loop NTPase fold protein n=1 Tax=Vibrio cholerae TaxID=666 RepID=UPI0000F1B7F1|nr:P-loop NTPase fold protein [Vibrio cholerae]EGQ8139788.1 NTPase KAP [Vibrio cholerae]EGQ9899075.1 NTPase KAP [Vibrio cholerae]EGR0074753.1 NTPase KAP [Vibrio cholerae]EGR0564632.1 NTPase KAP [Vibrio cholerae]EHY8704731.1 NTPase KAP [Vibrio cholerae]